MSLYTIVSKWMAINPKVWIEQDVLYARTAMFFQFLNLFSYCRTIAVDQPHRVIKITSRWLWVLKKQTSIPFDRIDYIDTHFKSIGTDWGEFFYRIQRTDQFEIFSIILFLKNPKQKYPLIKFRGEGAVHTGWQGVLLYGDGIIDFSGNQQQAFQKYLELLRRFTGAGLMPSYPEEYQKKLVYQCEKCGRRTWKNQKCMYCGGNVRRSQTT